MGVLFKQEVFFTLKKYFPCRPLSFLRVFILLFTCVVSHKCDNL